MDNSQEDQKQSKTKVGVELTPNPNTLKFIIDRDILAYGSVEFVSKEEAEGSPLPDALLALAEIETVFIGQNFISLTKKTASKWEPLVPTVFEIMKNHLDADVPFLSKKHLPNKPDPSTGGDIEERIKEVLDQEIRPAVARDGGDILFGSFDDGVLKLHLRGACSSCPSAVMTLKMGVETRLRQLFPEIREVIQA